jgi:hypothetical protein
MRMRVLTIDQTEGAAQERGTLDKLVRAFYDCAILIDQ